MEVFCVNAMTGVEEPICVEEDMTVGDAKHLAHAAFGFAKPSVMYAITPDYLQLSVEDTDVLGDDDDRLCDTPNVHDGCTMHVSLSSVRVADDLLAGRVSLCQLPAVMREETVCVLAAVQANPDELEHVHPSLKRSKEIVLAACRKKGHAIMWAHKSLRADREVALAAVQQCGTALSKLPDALRKDREIVLAAVSQQGDALSYAHKSIRLDREVATTAMRNHRSALDFVPDVFLADAEFMLEAQRYHGGAAVRSAHRSLFSNREFVLESVKLDPMPYCVTLDLVSRSLWDDRAFVLQVAASNGNVLEYKGPFMEDPEVVKAAVKQNPCALQHVAGPARLDVPMVLGAVTCNPSTLVFADSSIRSDRNFLIEACRANEYVLSKSKEVWESFGHDKDFVLAVVQENPRALRHCNFRHDLDVVRTAVQRDGASLCDAGDTARSDPDITLTALRNGANVESLSRAGNSLLCNKDFLLAALQVDSRVLDYADESLASDADLLRAAEQSAPAGLH